MKAADPFRFIFFDPAATRRIAASPWAILVGALLVVTAGIARNYDHLDLFRDAEWIVGPFVVSVISCVWIFFFIAIVLGLPSRKLPRQWLVFLTLFWMTAPCAWLYALPVEQWTDLIGAAKWNIGFLVTVSLWRVALIANALRVLTGNHWWRCIYAVMLPACVEMIVALFFTRFLSVVSVMGGVRTDPDNAVVQVATGAILTVCLIGLVGILLGHASTGRTIPKKRQPLPTEYPQRAFPALAVFIALALIAVACAASLLTVQPQVQLTRKLDRLARTRDWDAVIELAERTSPYDYSPQHFFPPRPYGTNFPFDAIARVAASHGDRAPAWLLEEWHHNALLTLDPEGLPPSSNVNPEVLSAWAKTVNGKHFLTTHRDKVLAATYESKREEVREVLDTLGNAASGESP